MKRFNSLSFTAVAFSLSLLMGSCGTEGDQALLDMVPAHASYVATVNVHKLLAQTGCPTAVDASGQWNPDALAILQPLAMPDLMEPMRLVLSLGALVEQDHVVIFSTPPGAAFMLTKTADPDAVASRLENIPGAQISKVEGFTTYSFDGYTIGLKAHTLAVAPAQEDLGEMLRHAKFKRFGQMIGVTNFLDQGEEEMHIAVNCGGSPSFSLLGDADKWACTSIDANAQALNIRVQVMDQEGKLDSIGNFFDPIDPDVLRYVPADAAVVAAFGHWNGSKAVQNMALAQLKDIFFFSPSGTTAFTLTPASANANLNDFDLAQWNVQDIAQMPQPQLRQRISAFKAEAGSRLKTLDSQLYAFSPKPEVQYFLDASDDYLILSVNREPSSGCENELAQTFRDKRAAVVVDVTEGSDLQSNLQLPCGLHFQATLDATTMAMRLTFYGTTPVLQRLVSMRQNGGISRLVSALFDDADFDDDYFDDADDADDFDDFDD